MKAKAFDMNLLDNPIFGRIAVKALCKAMVEECRDNYALTRATYQYPKAWEELTVDERAAFVGMFVTHHADLGDN